MELTIEKLIFGGQGLAKKDGKTYCVWNALPGETVKIKILKKTRSIYEALAEEILCPSPHRIEALEPHYLSCSPWQILSFESEKKWKETIAQETFERLGGIQSLGALEMFSDFSRQFAYRNKIEYSFCENNHCLSYGLHARNSHTLIPVACCLLAEPVLNETASHILEWLWKEKLPARCLDRLIIRCNGQGHCMGGLTLNENLGIKTLPDLKSPLRGFQILYKDMCILQGGDPFLIYDLFGFKFKFGLSNFFQINTAVFEKTLQDICAALDTSKPLIDFYCGVGTIGIHLKNFSKKITLVDSHPKSIAYAKENISLNSLSNGEAMQSEAEKMTSLINEASLILFDPPRAGLHPNIIKRLLNQKPQRLIYLSCNTATCARDIKALSKSYKLKSLKLYNFFPRTPHIESLAVLDLLSKGDS